MNPGNKRRDKNLGKKMLVLTCWLRVGRGGPIKVTEEFLPRTVKWNVDWRPQQTPEAELLLMKLTQTKSLSPA